MFDTLRTLCTLSSVSGDEKTVRDFIIEEIKDYCEYKVDALGNILFEKKGKKRTDNRVMLDAHMDEVGIIITDIEENGFLRFNTVGGIEKECLLFSRVIFKNKTAGVIGNKPIHLLSAEEAKKLPLVDNMYIDIGAKDKESAQKRVAPGDTAVLCGDYIESGDMILSKALDDRVGCAVLINLIKNYNEYDFCGSFSTMEEVGCIGARTAAFGLSPDFALVLEGTTASDIGDTPPSKEICRVGEGVAVSFMDRGTLYDRELYSIAINDKSIKKQTKRGTTGANNSAGIHLSKEGIRTLALSVPTRYIHSASSVCSKEDIISMYKMAEYMISAINKL